jgi:RNA polymerase sigma-70 factor (ECF subfamily)
MAAMKNCSGMKRDQHPALVALMPQLRRFGIALTGSGSDAEALIRSACERMLLRKDQFRDDVQIRVCMYRIMRSLWTEEASRPREHRPNNTKANEVMGDSDEAIDRKNVQPEIVRRALANLPEQQRIALILICLDNMSYKQTAEVLDIPIEPMANLIAGARAALHQQISMQRRAGVARSPIMPMRTYVEREEHC